MKNNQRGFSAVLGLLIAAVIVGIGFAGWYVWQQNEKDKKVETTASSEDQQSDNDPGVRFANPKKGAHFESSTPAHASTLAAVPVDIVIDFNFDLASNSTIKINKDGKDYGIGDTKVDSSKLALRRQMDMNAPDGVYTVSYNGCWPDKTCHDGSFQFAIDKGLLDAYQDMRNQKTVTVKLSQTKFQPMNIRISPDTTITWINDDSVEHYVNTDSHPAHTHVPGLNSKALKQGESYSFVFSGTGSYPYHCSAHAADMVGNIVVG